MAKRLTLKEIREQMRDCGWYEDRITAKQIEYIAFSNELRKMKRCLRELNVESNRIHYIEYRLTVTA